MTRHILAAEVVTSACGELGIELADLIALASIWIHPEVASAVNRPWFPAHRRANVGLRENGQQVEFVRQVIDGVTLDNNTYANVAFKQALGIDRGDFIGFHVCHIWPGTVYDARCYSHPANLVGIPAELSSLTDHHSHIVACLKFRSWELYGWKPAMEPAPERPESFPVRWREPFALNDAARKAARRKCKEAASDGNPPELVSVIPAVPRGETQFSSDAGPEPWLLAAFYLSKFDHEHLRMGNQGQTFDRIARILGVNRNTLKNQRDAFDSYTGSHRQGWKASLSPQLAAAFQELEGVDEHALRTRLLASLS